MTAPKVVRPMNCHPTFCGMLVEVEGGRLKTVSGDKDNPDSQGFAIAPTVLSRADEVIE
jgi:Molybdopterin oxidoreductase Fe4S4 domain